MKKYLYLIVLCALGACAGKTGECSTTCYSKSSGTNLGTETYQNYTKKECEEKLKNRQTSLTDCTMEWN